MNIVIKTKLDKAGNIFGLKVGVIFPVKATIAGRRAFPPGPTIESVGRAPGLAGDPDVNVVIAALVYLTQKTMKILIDVEVKVEVVFTPKESIPWLTDCEPDCLQSVGETIGTSKEFQTELLVIPSAPESGDLGRQKGPHPSFGTFGLPKGHLPRGVISRTMFGTDLDVVEILPTCKSVTKKAPQYTIQLHAAGPPLCMSSELYSGIGEIQ